MRIKIKELRNILKEEMGVLKDPFANPSKTPSLQDAFKSAEESLLELHKAIKANSHRFQPEDAVGKTIGLVEHAMHDLRGAVAMLAMVAKKK